MMFTPFAGEAMVLKQPDADIPEAGLGGPSLRVHVVSQSPLCSIFTVKGLNKICPPPLHVVSSNEDSFFFDLYGRERIRRKNGKFGGPKS